MRLRRFLALVLLVAPLLAQAHEPYVDIEARLSPEQQHATGIDTLSAEQLKLLNQLLREQPGEAAPPAAPIAVPQATTAPVVHDSIAPPAPTRVAPAPAPAPMFIGLDDQPIKTRIQGSVSGWAPGSEFLLANGQRWKVLKGEVKLPTSLQNPAVTVLPGIAGRWFLQVDENLPSARVYRIE
jgi:hypothetical protein